MSFIKDGSLICDWCFRVVYTKQEITKELIEFHTGWTKCMKCYERGVGKINNKEGAIEDLPIDFYAPLDPKRQQLRNIKYRRKHE